MPPHPPQPLHLLGCLVSSSPHRIASQAWNPCHLGFRPKCLEACEPGIPESTEPRAALILAEKRLPRFPTQEGAVSRSRWHGVTLIVTRADSQDTALLSDVLPGNSSITIGSFRVDSWERPCSDPEHEAISLHRYAKSC